MKGLIVDAAAILLAGIVFTRAMCVAYKASHRTHKHPAQYLSFGYSYLALGAGALLAALEICRGADMGTAPLWLLLAGSSGLILFDRRRDRCWALPNCPADGPHSRGAKP